jgi:hypothetical protein
MYLPQTMLGLPSGEGSARAPHKSLLRSIRRRDKPQTAASDGDQMVRAPSMKIRVSRRGQPNFIK